MDKWQSSCHVLIIDDHSKNIQTVASILQHEGYHMAFARSGEAALEHTEVSRFDLILLDIMMPDMDGYEVCRHLKAEPATQDIPIIFLTALTDTASLVKAFESGGVDYITKPFKAPELLARVKIHLELQRSRETLKAQNRELREANRLREDVERIVHHDLKSPLSAIISFPQALLAGGDLTDLQITYLKNVQEAGYRMLKMINQSLDLFKMERGLYQLSSEPVDLLSLFRKIIAEMEPWAAPRQVVLRIVNGSRLVDGQEIFLVEGEDLLCYSMLENLLKNALEASSEGDVVTITLERDEMATIRIHNSGVVCPDLRERFFEKYATSGKKGKGTGLGTYSAKLFAEVQGGSIGMTTSEAEGTTVSIRLPA